MNFGYFDEQAREYVITRPDTPRPWSNYIGSAEFGGVITNNAAGYTFYRSAAQGRLTRFLFNAPPAHWPGRFVYLRDESDGDFWSLSWMPVGKPLSGFAAECRHGLGYTRLRSVWRGVEASATLFAPLGALYEVWDISVRLVEGPSRRLKLFPYVEPQCNWSADDDTRNLQYNQYIAQARLAGEGLLDFSSNVNMPEDPEHFTNKDQQRHSFFGLVGKEPSGHDADRDEFLGPYGSYASPAAVVSGACAGSTAYGDMPCGAFEIPCELRPGETMRFALVFGVGRAEREGEAARAAMGTPAAREAALAAVRQHWNERLGALAAETPEPLFDRMANVWAPYNNLMTFYWSRTASLVYAGERDGLGYRDTVQDLVGTAALIPEETRARLELMLTGQYANGGCKPVVQPFLHRPGAEALPDVWRADDGLWLFNAVTAYVRETGDSDFLRRELPFADRDAADVFSHLRRALDFNLERRGAHGLPCGLHADWNDCLRLGERGESVFVAFQLRYGLREYRALAERLGETRETAWADERLAELDAAIERHAWDGEWYLRAYRFDGMKFGARECGEGRIFLNPQSWAILSGHATGERARRLLETVERELATPSGLMLCAPPYVSTDPQVCLARLFNPGCKENAGVFYHTQGWAVLAAAEIGEGERAWNWLRRALPAFHNDRAEIRQVEPYVVCQSAHSIFSPFPGRGRVSWLSGAAVWNYAAMTAGILGVRPDYDGLRIAPCVPPEWRRFRFRRRFRGALYEIEVENTNGVSSGVLGVEAVGATVRGDGLILPAPAGEKVRVRVRMG